MPAQYSFVTNWELKAPLEDVWDAIYNSLDWPQWWRGVQSVIELQKNDEYFRGLWRWDTGHGG